MEAETKLQLDIDIEATTKKLKDLLADLDIAKREYEVLQSRIKKDLELKEQYSGDLTQTLNDIASAKLEWAHEKDAQLKAIEEKEKGVDSILSRSAVLDRKELEVNRIYEETKNVAADNNRILSNTQAEKLAIENHKKEIELNKIDVEKIRKSTEDLIQKFKDGVSRVVSELSQI